MHPGSPYYLVWHSSLSFKSFLDRQTTRSTFKFLYLPIWSHGRLQMRYGQDCLPSQGEEGRETTRRMQMRGTGEVLLPS